MKKLDRLIERIQDAIVATIVVDDQRPDWCKRSGCTYFSEHKATRECMLQREIDLNQQHPENTFVSREMVDQVLTQFNYSSRIKTLCGSIKRYWGGQ